jgi:hypothetical protein
MGKTAQSICIIALAIHIWIWSLVMAWLSMAQFVAIGQALSM